MSALRGADLLNVTERGCIPTSFYQFDATHRMHDGRPFLYLMGVFQPAGSDVSRTVCVGVRNPPLPYVHVWLNSRRFDPLPLTRATARNGAFRSFQLWKGACAAKRLEKAMNTILDDVHPRSLYNKPESVMFELDNKVYLTSNIMDQHNSLRSSALKQIHFNTYKTGCVRWSAKLFSHDPAHLATFVRACGGDNAALGVGSISPYTEQAHHDAFAASIVGGRVLNKVCGDLLMQAHTLFSAAAYIEVRYLDDIEIADAAPIDIPAAIYDLEVSPGISYIHKSGCKAPETGFFKAAGLPFPKPNTCTCTPTVVETFPTYDRAILCAATRIVNGSLVFDFNLAIDPRLAEGRPSVCKQSYADGLTYWDVRVATELELLNVWDAVLRACGVCVHSGYNIVNFDLPFIARRYAALCTDFRLTPFCQHGHRTGRCDECKQLCKHDTVLEDCELCAVPEDEKGWLLFVPYGFGSCVLPSASEMTRIKKTSTYTAATGVVVKVDMQLFCLILADMLPIVASQTDTAQKMGSNSLDCAARHLLKKSGKFEFPYSKINPSWLQAVIDEPVQRASRLYEYCMYDSLLAALLYKMFQVSTQLCCTGTLVGQSPGVVSTRANMNKFSSAINLYVRRIANDAVNDGFVEPVVAKFINTEAKQPYEGAYVFTPAAGRQGFSLKQKNELLDVVLGLPEPKTHLRACIQRRMFMRAWVPVVVTILDFASLYPSQIKDLNISGDTLVRDPALLKQLIGAKYPINIIRKLKEGEPVNRDGRIPTPHLSDTAAWANIYRQMASGKLFVYLDANAGSPDYGMLCKLEVNYGTLRYVLMLCCTPAFDSVAQEPV